MNETTPAYHSALRELLTVIRRRPYALILPVLAAAGVAFAASNRQEKLYEASAEVLLKRQNFAATLTGTVDPAFNQQDDRIIQTQADLAVSPEVARRTLERVGARESPIAFAGRSSVKPKPNSDFLIFSVRDPRPQAATRLVNAFATSYTEYRRDLDTDAVRRARESIADRLERLRAQGEGSKTLIDSLVSKEQQLRTIEALQTGNGFVVRRASTAAQVQPQPARNVALGVGLGLLVGLGLALLLARLDTRIRTEEEIGELLGGLSLIGRVPAPPRKLANARKLVTVEEPVGPNAETFAILRVAIELANLDRRINSLMVTSALAEEGKSTTIANIAVSAARAGARVRLVDLDLRRPMLGNIFGLADRPGLTHVVRGLVPLDEALTSVRIGDEEEHEDDLRPRGRLEVLSTGILPPTPAEFVGSRVVGEVLSELREGADLLLVDSAPMLPVSDTLTASGYVDALIAVTNMQIARRQHLKEFGRLLKRAPVPTLGYIVTGVEATSSGYGYGAYYSSNGIAAGAATRASS